MNIQREARTPRYGGKKLSHLLVKKAEPNEDGDHGHIVEHHFENNGMEYQKPKEYVFAADEGPDALEHIAKHMGIKAHPEEGGPEKGNAEEEAEYAEEG